MDPIIIKDEVIIKEEPFHDKRGKSRFVITISAAVTVMNCLFFYYDFIIGFIIVSVI